MRFAMCVSRMLPGACQADLIGWAIGNTEWRDIEWDCVDAEVSFQPTCWCGKREWTDRCVRGAGANGPWITFKDEHPGR